MQLTKKKNKEIEKKKVQKLQETNIAIKYEMLIKKIIANAEKIQTQTTAEKIWQKLKTIIIKSVKKLRNDYNNNKYKK